MPTTSSCLGFAVDCGVLWKGAGVAIMGLTLFVGSVYLLLSAILGRTMGYLVLMVSLTGWLAIQSSLWLFGYWSQGIETPTNLGPRGSEPAWIALEASPNSTSDRYEVFSTYPDQPWAPPGSADTADIQSVGGAVTSFLAEHTNEELGLAETDPTAITGTQFAIDSIDFATAEDGKTKVAVVQSHFTGGGPLWTVSLYYDSGSVPRYSYMFLLGSIILFLIHLPFLDRAEKKRKAFLTGGGAPAWYGPA
ncbi:MAG TPA: hypothetical protein VNG34_12415 [Actinomycetota bacterium]|jgi:hypothetical protein|nr:hypothetical protein [Actinomycetota bacterium]